MFTKPILFIIFNRPRTTKKVFEVIRKIKPTQLFIAADGPRRTKEGEKIICDQTRSLVLNMIDWPCKVTSLFLEENIGCGKAVCNAITWFFDHVDEGVILEDDCLPDLSFFSYCSTLLERYRFNDKIMHIGGNNFQFGIKRGDGDYYYSFFSHNWGWATWKRAWKYFEYDLEGQKKLIRKIYKVSFKHNKSFIKFLDNRFPEIRLPQNHIWDIQWHFSLVKNTGIAIIPNQNLVQNIGFGNDGTHTLNEEDWNTQNIAQRLKSFSQPSVIKIDSEADYYTMQKIFKVNDRYPIKSIYLRLKEHLVDSGLIFFKLSTTAIKLILPSFIWNQIKFRVGRFRKFKID